MKRILTALLMFGASVLSCHAGNVNLVQNPAMEELAPGKQLPNNYLVQGAAFWGRLGGRLDFATNGIIFPGNAPAGSSVSQMVTGIDQTKGRWIMFRFRGLAEDGFSIKDDSLKMKIEFFSKNGTNYLDCASRTIYSEIAADRKHLTINGDYNAGGAAVWRSYELEELIPFQEVDAVRLTVSCDSSTATRILNAAFLVDDFSLVQRLESITGRVDPAKRIAAQPSAVIDEATLVSLGGRWYYKPALGEVVSATDRLTVTEDNADRLFYKSSRYYNPFLHNMTSWLRAGYKDRDGNIVTRDKLVKDNVVLTFKGDGFLTVRTRGLPNHPTALFPGFNPSYIQEIESTYRLPLNPVINPGAISMDAHNKNRALPMGPVGVAANGVPFYNPFDAGMEDASNIMDYCCGHPNPMNQYHYHKYPICVNTPFVDKGDAPSEVIGFAFDGLPIYGPYESAGLMAKDSTARPLNAFNAVHDDVRGWHYHVTPGKFPYIIGGYFAKAEPSNLERPHGGPGGGPRGPGGRGGPPPRGGGGGGGSLFPSLF
ncbi:MAG: YHYH protein [Candidatus Methylacidiphilales bacterium]